MSRSQRCRERRFGQVALGLASNTALHATGAVTGLGSLEGAVFSARA